VILNTNSQIRVEYSDMYREVHLLQGEALFTVSKHAGRPFRVYAGNGRIEALGTAFSVHLKGEDVDVTVAEGRVSLASIKPSVGVPQRATLPGSGRGLEAEFVESLGTLSAGQVATIRSMPVEAAEGSVATMEIVEPVTSDELAERLAWREGVLMFSGDTLEDVVREVSRYTTVSIEIADPAVGGMRIGGRFPVGETEAMLAALEANFDLRVTRIGRHRVVLSAANE
jgi:transmembrane sensor